MSPRTFISIVIGFVAWNALAAEFVPPPGWELKSQGSKGSAYARGDCGLVVNESKPMNGPYKAAAEEYIDNAVKRLAEQGEQVVSMEPSTTLERTGAVAANRAPQQDRAVAGGPSFLGVWHGANHLGQTHIHPDGTYSSPNGARGTWQATGERSILFTSGPLTAWDGGRAKVSDKNALEFHWTSPTLGKQYFSYIRR